MALLADDRWDHISPMSSFPSFKVQMKCFSLIAEFERAAEIRNIAVYRFSISFPVPKLQRFKDQ